MKPGSFSNENAGRQRQNRPSLHQSPALNPSNNSSRNILNSSRDSTNDSMMKAPHSESATKTVPKESSGPTPNPQGVQELLQPLKQVKREADPLLSSLFTTMMYPDVAFVVDGRRFSAHRGILAIGCEYFRNLFEDDDEESKGADVEIEGISAAAFKTFLEYIYKKEVNLNEELALELLQVSSQYSLPELNKISGEYLLMRLTVDNFVRIAQVVDKFGVQDLRKQILKFMSRNLVPLRQKEDLCELPVSILIEVLDLLQPKEGVSNFSVV